jgi:hypothetical protein
MENVASILHYDITKLWIVDVVAAKFGVTRFFPNPHPPEWAIPAIFNTLPGANGFKQLLGCYAER